MAEESDGTNSYFKLIGVVKKLDGEAISVIPTMTMAIRIKSKSSVFQKKEPHMKYTI